VLHVISHQVSHWLFSEVGYFVLVKLFLTNLAS